MPLVGYSSELRRHIAPSEAQHLSAQILRQAQVLLELRETANDEQAWSDFRDLVFEDEDFLFLFNPEFDGIEETEWARQHAVFGLKFNEWFRPFDPTSHGAPAL